MWVLETPVGGEERRGEERRGEERTGEERGQERTGEERRGEERRREEKRKRKGGNTATVTGRRGEGTVPDLLCSR